MREQSTVFGEVAGVYDDVRPGYSDELVAEVLAFAGAGVRQAVEIGAGTGIGTRAFVRHGVAVRCVEADPQMAAVLRARFAGTPAVLEALTGTVRAHGGVVGVRLDTVLALGRREA